MEHSQESIHSIVLKQRNFFKSKKTFSIEFRIEQLLLLKDALIKNKDKIQKALYNDLNKSETEAYLCDIGPVLIEINEAVKNLRKWAKPKNKFSGLVCFPSLFSKIYRIPYGVTLIISPFNFPVYLSLGVLVASISGGNTTMIKCSSKSKYTTEVLKEIISNTYKNEYIAIIDGGHDVADYCLNERFDKIFYTGSPNVAKHVMSKASENLTPVALELGGETGNWCIIRKDADIKDAAKKIAFAKICNAGQICININQVAVASEVADAFVKELKNEIIDQIGENPCDNPEYPKLISSGALKNCINESLKYKDRIVFGGQYDENNNKFSTTIIYPVNINEDIVKHELFSPLLPIVKFDDCNINELINVIEEREHGLALYIFTKNIKWAKSVMQTMQYGGGCINEVIYHFLAKGTPFNGVGHSGTGSYHGIFGFNEFTHPSTVLIGSNKFNLNLRYHPYTNEKGKKHSKTISKFFK